MRFFFHTDSDVRVSDTEGEELASLEEARAVAVRIIGEMLHGSARKFWGSRPWTQTVTDAGGMILFTIELHGRNSAPLARND